MARQRLTEASSSAGRAGERSAYCMRIQVRMAPDLPFPGSAMIFHCCG
jgi:hypothetical protein